MGKNLKGKECGKGIYQRKDGLYSARFYAKDGKRKEKYFDTLPAAKNWLADARYEERHSLIVTSPDMTVDKWFTYWIENIVCDLAPNTKRNYRERYKWNIQPVLGAMCIGDVNPCTVKLFSIGWKPPTQALQSGRLISRWEPCSNRRL